MKSYLYKQIVYGLLNKRETNGVQQRQLLLRIQSGQSTRLWPCSPFPWEPGMRRGCRICQLCPVLIWWKEPETAEVLCAAISVECSEHCTSEQPEARAGSATEFMTCDYPGRPWAAPSLAHLEQLLLSGFRLDRPWTAPSSWVPTFKQLRLLVPAFLQGKAWWMLEQHHEGSAKKMRI